MDISEISTLIKDVLVEANLYSDSAHALLLGTGAQESRYQYIKQLGDGPAKSFFEIHQYSSIQN